MVVCFWPIERWIHMRLITIIFVSIFLSACQNGFEQFYKPIADAGSMPDVQLLNEEDKPVIFSSNDLNRDVLIARSKGYVPIGDASFNGKLGTEQDVINQAKRVRAVLVLVTSQFAETRAITTPLFVPNNQTTYYNGTTNGTVNGTYGSANYYGMYSSSRTSKY